MLRLLMPSLCVALFWPPATSHTSEVCLPTSSTSFSHSPENFRWTLLNSASYMSPSFERQFLLSGRASLPVRFIGCPFVQMAPGVDMTELSLQEEAINQYQEDSSSEKPQMSDSFMPLESVLH